MDNINNLYVPVRERIFARLKSKAISQRDFSRAINVSPQTITAWKMGENFSFMKKLKPIADALETTEGWLLNGVTEIIGMDVSLSPTESLDELFSNAEEYSSSMIQQLKNEIDEDPELLEKLNTVSCAMDIFIKLYEYGKWYLDSTVKLSSESLTKKEKLPFPTVDESEERLLSLYRKLNQEGQEKLLDYADDLTESGKYKKVSSLQMGTKEV